MLACDRRLIGPRRRSILESRVIQFLLLTSLLLTSWAPAFAQVPKLMRYQGQAIDSQGVPLEGNYSLTFRLYDAATGGNKMWEETQSAVPLSGGHFSVLLGSRTPLGMDWTKACWLSVQVNADAELAPRQQITSVPLAVMAEQLDGPICTMNGRLGIRNPKPEARFHLGPTKASQYTDYDFIVAQENAGTLARIVTYSDNPNHEASFGFERLRGNSNAPTPLLAGDRIAEITWNGLASSTTDLRSVAKIRGVAEVNFNGQTQATSLIFATAEPGGGMAGPIEHMRIAGSGNVAIGTATADHILTVRQGSDTDPIADSWTVHPCDRKNKNILRPAPSRGYLAQLRSVQLYEWQRIPKVTDEDAEEALDKEQTDKPRKTRPTQDELEAKKRELTVAKSLLPKFSRKRLGMAIDDPNVPDAVLTFDDQGNKSGIDLVAYIGYLHVALKEAADRIDALETKVGAPAP